MPQEYFKLQMDEETFKRMSVAEQNWILLTSFSQYCQVTDKRLKVVENRKLADKAVAGASGFVGGFLAILTKSIW